MDATFSFYRFLKQSDVIGLPIITKTNTYIDDTIVKYYEENYQYNFCGNCLNFKAMDSSNPKGMDERAIFYSACYHNAIHDCISFSKGEKSCMYL